MQRTNVATPVMGLHNIAVQSLHLMIFFFFNLCDSSKDWKSLAGGLTANRLTDLSQVSTSGPITFDQKARSGNKHWLWARIDPLRGWLVRLGQLSKKYPGTNSSPSYLDKA